MKVVMNAKKAKKLRKISANIVGNTEKFGELIKVYKDLKKMHNSGEVKA